MLTEMASRGAGPAIASSPGNRVLAVDDEAISLAFLKKQLADLGYDVVTAVNAREGLKELERSGDTIDVVLLDRIMPGIDGIAMAEEMRADSNLRHIPVIMQTGADSSKDIQEGIDAGVFYYLTKPLEPTLLRSVVNAAMKEAARRRSMVGNVMSQNNNLGLMQSCRFHLRTPDEASRIAGFLAPCFADPERAQIGLTELMLNGIEHGNLELGYEMKTQLTASGEWAAEIERRLTQEAYANRFLDVTVLRKDGGVYVSIADQGKGFDWREYLRINPGRASDSHGRGIVQSRTVAFDKLVYNEAGNKVVAFMSDETKINW